ncbi:MAG: hypothetical protein QOK19_1580 [Solirubrobacteraceae bacterium]|jgi:hypothetical protein|nr:hypothetical protein [Solirubrobacterales bacterium]MEA2216019.1 hypothetical protein [Solirubrobacteraceae bacterium]
MSAPSTPDPGGGPWRRLPERLRPRERELPGRGELRIVEGAVLVLVALLLAVATVNDVVRQAGVNHRLVADLRTWRHYTHHNYKNVTTDQLTFGAATKRDVVCGNTVPGPPKQRTQICLAVTGPTRAGLRTVSGGWYLPAGTEYDKRAVRYGCFGQGTVGLCRK